MQTRVLLVDDQVLFVESLRSVLESRGDDIEVVGVAYDGRTAIKIARELHPDVILMDVRMPEMDGVEATKKIHEFQCDIQIVMLTTYDDDHYVRNAIENGAIGYLLKDIPPQELINAIRTVRSGTALMPSSIMSKLLPTSANNVSHYTSDENRLPEWYYLLSRKERQILRLVIEGYSNQEIAERVFFATQTVKNYLSTIYEKLDVHSRLEAIKASHKYLNYL